MIGVKHRIEVEVEVTSDIIVSASNVDAMVDDVVVESTGEIPAKPNADDENCNEPPFPSPQSVSALAWFSSFSSISPPFNSNTPPPSSDIKLILFILLSFLAYAA